MLDAVVASFWNRGYEATSVRDLIEKTGVTGASLYNAFGDKRSIYQRALDHYVEGSVAERMRHCEKLPPRRAIGAFFDEIVKRSIDDPDHKGCMLVNAALDVARQTLPFAMRSTSCFNASRRSFYVACRRARRTARFPPP